jgi:hypothetical protein
MLFLATGCDRDDASGSWLGPVEELPSPGSPGARYPHLATGPGGSVVVSWLQPVADGVHELRYALLDGARWGAARTVASGADWFVNWADFPSVVPGASGALAAHWLQQTPGHVYSYAIRLAVTADGGQSWSTPATPHDDGTATEHGFVTLLPDGEGFLAVWLDGRRTAGSDGHAHGSGAMTLRSLGVGRDASHRGPGLELDGRVCDCCQTDAAMTSRGPVVVYRDRTEDEIRDVAVLRRDALGWSTPSPVHADGWRMPGCPVNGPAIDAAGDALAVAWFTAPDQPRVRLAFSSDAGRTFSAPIEIAAGAVAGHVDVVLLDGERAVVSWLGDGPGGTSLLARPFTRRGADGATVTVARTAAARAAGFPQMVRSGDRLVFAWTDAAEPTRLRTAAAELR